VRGADHGVLLFRRVIVLRQSRTNDGNDHCYRNHRAFQHGIAPI
jgi:hypothetical protein